MGVKYNRKHGMHDTKLYNVWSDMKSRCKTTSHRAFKHYGGRGIKVCDRWSDFINFYNDVIDGYKEGLQLDRINNDGNYEPNNVRWVTRSQNQKNKRNKAAIQSEIDGVTCRGKIWYVNLRFDTKEEAEEFAKIWQKK